MADRAQRIADRRAYLHLYCSFLQTHRALNLTAILKWNTSWTELLSMYVVTRQCSRTKQSLSL